MRRRRGFTLAELLVAIVLLGIVGIGLSRLLQSQMRYFQRATGARDARSVSRNTINLMQNEMKMIEPRGITAATTTSITVRVPFQMGVYCAMSTGTFLPVDSLIAATAVPAGYAYRETAPGSPYTYFANGAAATVGLAATCTAAGITPVPGGQELAFTPTIGTLSAGAPIFRYQTITYAFGNSTLVPGRTALWRRVAGGADEEVAVPFDSTSVFRFYVSGSGTAQDAVPGTLNTISGLELVLTGESERSSPGTGVPESSDSRVSIFFRNAVN